MKSSMAVKTAKQRVASKSANTVVQYLAGNNCDLSVRQYIDAALADNTLRAYRADLKHFIAWGGKIPACPEQVATYVAHHATNLAFSTLSRRLVAIAYAHTAKGLASPTNSAVVRATMKGVRRSRNCSVRQVAPLLKSHVLQMVRGLQGLRGLRDKALLLIGFASAMRRSELVSLDIEDIQFSEKGAIIRLRRSKTDQEGKGRDIAIPRVRGRNCPVRNLLSWIDASGITSGALFRQVNRYDQLLPHRLMAQSVATIVKQRATAAGFDARLFSGHSLRAGFVTNAANGGASSASIREQTGHKSDAMLQNYIRSAQIFNNNPNLKIWKQNGIVK
jgi:site-specific recombinase XerD